MLVDMPGVGRVAAYGPPEVAVGSDRSDGPSPVFPLLLMVIGLAAATVWFVWLPLFDRTPDNARSCEVYVRPSGATTCVPYWTPGSAAARGDRARRAGN
jgi:hypothetical protein